MFMISEGIAPFHKLKTAANVVKRFMKDKLDANDFMDKMESQNYRSLLKKFNAAIKPYDTVKIVEKDTSADLLAATTPVVEEETKIEPLARPNFPLVVKVNRSACEDAK